MDAKKNLYKHTFLTKIVPLSLYMGVVGVYSCNTVEALSKPLVLSSQTSACMEGSVSIDGATQVSGPSPRLNRGGWVTFRFFIGLALALSHTHM